MCAYLYENIRKKDFSKLPKREQLTRLYPWDEEQIRFFKKLLKENPDKYECDFDKMIFRLKNTTLQ